MLSCHTGSQDRREAFVAFSGPHAEENGSGFRDEYEELLLLLKAGCAGTVVEGRTLRDLAADGQNVHTSIVNCNLRRLVEAARPAGTPLDPALVGKDLTGTPLGFARVGIALAGALLDLARVGIAHS